MEHQVVKESHQVRGKFDREPRSSNLRARSLKKRTTRSFHFRILRNFPDGQRKQIRRSPKGDLFCIVVMTDSYIQIIVSAMASPTGWLFRLSCGVASVYDDVLARGEGCTG